MYIHSCMHAYVLTYQHTIIHTYITTYITTYIHTYIHTYKNVHTCSRILLSLGTFDILRNRNRNINFSLLKLIVKYIAQNCEESSGWNLVIQCSEYSPLFNVQEIQVNYFKPNLNYQSYQYSLQLFTSFS